MCVVNLPEYGDWLTSDVKIKARGWVVVAPLILPLGRQRQADLCEFKASLVYREHSRTGSKATQRNPVSKNQREKIKANRRFKEVFPFTK